MKKAASMIVSLMLKYLVISEDEKGAYPYGPEGLLIFSAAPYLNVR